MPELTKLRLQVPREKAIGKKSFAVDALRLPTSEGFGLAGMGSELRKPSRFQCLELLVVETEC